MVTSRCPLERFVSGTWRADQQRCAEVAFQADGGHHRWSAACSRFAPGHPRLPRNAIDPVQIIGVVPLACGGKVAEQLLRGVKRASAVLEGRSCHPA